MVGIERRGFEVHLSLETSKGEGERSAGAGRGEGESEERTDEQSSENTRFPTASRSRNEVDLSRDELNVQMKSEVSNVLVGLLLSKPGEGRVREPDEDRFRLRLNDSVLVELVDDFGLRW